MARRAHGHPIQHFKISPVVSQLSKATTTHGAHAAPRFYRSGREQVVKLCSYCRCSCFVLASQTTQNVFLYFCVFFCERCFEAPSRLLLCLSFFGVSICRSKHAKSCCLFPIDVSLVRRRSALPYADKAIGTEWVCMRVRDRGRVWYLLPPPTALFHTANLVSFDTISLFSPDMRRVDFLSVRG